MKPHTLFDLTKYAHSTIFDNQTAWEALKKLKEYLLTLPLGNISSCIPPSVTLIHPELIFIGEGTVVEAGALIEGPCYIGKNCQVRHGAYVRPNVLTGDQCVIGHATEVKHSIFLDGAQAPHFNYVGDSILGNRVNIGAGVVCANFRLDHKEVIIELAGEKIPSGMRKFGTCLGDDSQIGCNSVINPGVILRKRTLSRACTSIQKSNITHPQPILSKEFYS